MIIHHANRQIDFTGNHWCIIGTPGADWMLANYDHIELRWLLHNVRHAVKGELNSNAKACREHVRCMHDRGGLTDRARDRIMALCRNAESNRIVDGLPAQVRVNLLEGRGL